MKTVLPTPQFIRGLFGQQKVAEHQKYRKLQFVEIYQKDNIYLAYNMLTQSLAKITAEEFHLLSQNTFDFLPQAQELIQNWFAVPMEQQDTLLYEQLCSLYHLFDCSRFFNNYLIFTTTDCNARCFYCYEKGIRHIDMSEETARDTAKFMISHCNGEKVFIRWFGGEPLCNLKVIDIITSELQKANITYSSKMTSNAYLFDSELIEKAKEQWKLQSVQVTLDGTQEVYNRCKNYIHSDPNPFARVMRNIELLIAAEISVSIRLNMERHNQEDLKKLADFLCEKFKGERYLTVYAALLYDEEDKRSIVDKKELTEALLLLEKQFVANGLSGYALNSSKFGTAYCKADSAHSAVINPEGGLGRCEHYPFDDLWGTVRQPDYKSAAFDIWREKQNNNDICRACTYYIKCRAPKKCSAFAKKCDEYYQLLLREQTHRSMLATYYKWKQKGGNA